MARQGAGSKEGGQEEHMKALGDLRRAHANGGRDPSGNVLDLVDAVERRQDDLRDAESRHVREVALLRDRHSTEMRAAETARIDAIRAVDVGAVQQAASVADMRANTLAAQVVTSAEALRTQVQDAATAATIALAAALSPIQTDVADLRKAQYEAQGQKTQVVETQQKGASSGLWIGIAIAGLALLISVAMIVTVIAIATKGFTA